MNHSYNYMDGNDLESHEVMNNLRWHIVNRKDVEWL